MAFKLPCPNCGPRDVYEFSFDSELKIKPGNLATIREWRRYFYFSNNEEGIQREWWYHMYGCGSWFVVLRNTITNEIMTD